MMGDQPQPQPAFQKEDSQEIPAPSSIEQVIEMENMAEKQLPLHPTESMVERMESPRPVPGPESDKAEEV